MNIFKSGNDDNEQQQRQQGLRMPSIPNPLTSTFENVAIPVRNKPNQIILKKYCFH